MQTVFQNNEKCYALNDHSIAKTTKSRIFIKAFLGSHTSNGGKFLWDTI